MKRFKVGDKARVLDVGSSAFKLNDIVIIYKIDNDGCYCSKDGECGYLVNERLDPISGEVIIYKENLIKAHKEGCEDVKKVLETLAPELFDKPFPKLMIAEDGEIVFFTGHGKGTVIGKHSDEWNMEAFKDYHEPYIGERE